MYPAYEEAQPGPQTADEAARLGSLSALGILDTPREPEFDDLVELAAAICDSPISMLSLVDEDRQWFKAVKGVDLTETPRDVAFCHHAIQQSTLMMVEDAQDDPRFADNPMVTAEGGWRFYAGMPLQSPEGYNVGSLCVLDQVPRTLTAEQQRALRVLAGQVNARLELRAHRLALEESLQESRAARARAEMLEARFQAFMDAGPFLAYMKDAEGRMLYYNARLAQLLQASRSDLLNKLDGELWPADLAQTYRTHDLQVLATNELQVQLERTMGPDGKVSVWRSFKFPCTSADGSRLVGGISVEVTEELSREAEVARYQAELEVANQRLGELAATDPLTGLANRRSFDEAFEPAFHQARLSRSALSLLLVDVDHFKQHNDRFGHAHGDEVLCLLAQRMRSSFRKTDLTARFGGEEFVVLLPDTEVSEAEALAARFLEELRATPWPRARVSVSIGVSTLRPATRDAQHLLGRADEALYAAKQRGRDRVVSFADEIGCWQFVER